MIVNNRGPWLNVLSGLLIIWAIFGAWFSRSPEANQILNAIKKLVNSITLYVYMYAHLIHRASQSLERDQVLNAILTMCICAYI